ncbi:MAG: amidohydrolase/deacetylase family metallohydrolase [Byssovorax sp.]
MPLFSRTARSLAALLFAAASGLVHSAAAAAEPAPIYDLLIAHGRVLDPASGRDGSFDVAITGGRIARIAPSIDPSTAKAVIDAAGLTVTPGLIDLHTHVYAGEQANHYLSDSPLAARVDEVAPRSCTTTVVDAGSTGHRTFEAFEQKIIARSSTRVLAFLNIVGAGMRGGRFEQDPADLDARATAAMIARHRGEIVGIKVAHWAGPGWEPVSRAVEAGTSAGVRVMVDFGGHIPELSLEELLMRRLRPGDVLTHVYADVHGRTPIVDERGALRPYVRAARERGIFFDLGYGGASFVFRQARPALLQGLWPDSVSTDMHRSSLHGSMHDLPTVLSKLLALGIDLPELIRRSAATPAAMIGRTDLGRLVEGGEADVALLRVESGRFDFTDVEKARIEGSRRLTCQVTVRDGKVVWDARGQPAGR